MCSRACFSQAGQHLSLEGVKAASSLSFVSGWAPPQAMSWYHNCLSAIILTMAAAYTACALSHIATMWTLRNDFEIAARSPVLAIVSGTVCALVSYFTLCRASLFRSEVVMMLRGETVGIFHYALIVDGPLILLCFTGAYACRGLRLVVMYHPDMRARWGKRLKQHTVVKGMALLFVIMEILLWSATAAFGLTSVAGVSRVFLVLDNLLTITTWIVLAGKLRKADDLFRVSREIQLAGCCMLAALVALPLMFLGPVWIAPYAMQLAVVLKFHAALWFTNIRPIRAVLRQRHGCNKKGVRAFFPYVPWERARRVVADEDSNDSRALQMRSSGHLRVDGGLEQILNFPPLLLAFDDFCVKALCIESLRFLAAVMEFKESSTDSGKFTSIVETFIRNGAPFEVNISSDMKKAVLNQADAASFAALSLDDKVHILDDAEKEVGKMLSENLVDKFRATTQYKDIIGLIFSAEASFPEPSRAGLGETPME